MTERIRIEYKVVVVGASFVGKTSISTCFVGEEFEQTHKSTIGAAFLQRVVPVDSYREIVMGIWDTAGQERFRAMIPMYYRGAAVALVVYDVTDPASFEAMQDFIDDITDVIPDVAFFIAGNKIDKPEDEHVVSVEDAKELADNLNAPLFFTSARTGEGVQELFGSIIEFLKQDVLTSQEAPKPTNHVILTDKPTKPKKDCC